jgi:hypothetical protein
MEIADESASNVQGLHDCCTSMYRGIVAAGLKPSGCLICVLEQNEQVAD